VAAASVLPYISVEEYLRSSYEPDVDYVDGLLEERNLGEIDHGALQRRLILLLCSLSESLEERVFPETRVQVDSSRFRVPDVCVMPPGWQGNRIIQTAPMLCLEVLSPEDRMIHVLRRTRDFFAMGVPEIWIFDPEERKAYRLLPGTTLQEVTDRLESVTGEISLDLSQVFRTGRS
jgi:Uma2 family endonuclease